MQSQSVLAVALDPENVDVWTIEYSRAALPCTLPPEWLELPDLLSNLETLI